MGSLKIRRSSTSRYATTNCDIQKDEDFIVDKVNVFTLSCHHCRFRYIRQLELIFGAFWSFFKQSRMFASIRECTRAHPETFPQQRKSKIAIYHRARRSKFEIRNSSFILASLACFYAQFINIDESLNQKHLPCADCFQSIESISTQEIYHYGH